MKSIALSASALERHDAVLLITDHAAVDYEAVQAHAPLVVDTRGVLRGTNGRVVKA
jgi:UDP-N-acetyl-D-glucosamine dehydrogenase